PWPSGAAGLVGANKPTYIAASPGLEVVPAERMRALPVKDATAIFGSSIPGHLRRAFFGVWDPK
ncbi:MAG: hypothetical protein ABL894_01895, partial [Hyphomicrobium sp.]